jgi:hypothetical protein
MSTPSSWLNRQISITKVSNKLFLLFVLAWFLFGLFFRPEEGGGIFF